MEALQYNYATVYPPEGVDSAYRRSGFIHPACSPKGNVLTTVQPKDHYHHYGVWNPWTRLEYEGKTYDLWNLGDKQGTVRARDVQATYGGDVFAGYAANLDHYIFTPETEKVIMNEVWNVKTWNVPEALRIWDEKANGGRGDVFVNFAPAKNEDWLLSPGGKYTLRYRIVTYDGEMTKERAESLWCDFAYPPQLIIK